jgi:hypothetical protein
MNFCAIGLCRSVLARNILVLLAVSLTSYCCCIAQAKNSAPEPAPDVLVLSNGDTLHGKLVKETGGKVTFHTEAFGDVDVAWDHVKEIHTAQAFGVLSTAQKPHGRRPTGQIPTGTLDVADQAITVHGENTSPTPIPVKDAQVVVDAATLDKEIHHEPSFFAGWNGAATAGAALGQATQNQTTFSGGIGLVRTVPSVSWLDPRNRTQFDFTASYGKLSQPGTPTVKSSIYHADAERDLYFSPRMFALVQTAFDHNFAQDLQLQQIYGGGLGLTVYKTPRAEADFKATMQYEKQQFITGTAGTNQNLIGSTFAAAYVLSLKALTFTQEVAYIPAYNTPRAYSANETDTLAITAHKNFGFSIGTIDSYLNNPPATIPPTKRNSFQFTMGLTYAIKSKY